MAAAVKIAGISTALVFASACSIACAQGVPAGKAPADGSGAVPTRPAGAGAFPTRPIRIVIGFTPGGQPDIFSRLIAARLTEALGQNVLVDNRPGAGGTIGAKLVADAVPDGHTLLAVSAAHVIQPSIAKLSYDTARDFAGVAKMFTSAYLLVVPNTLPVHSVRDLIALAQARPGQLNFGSAGTGSGTHFAGEVLKESAKIDIVHIPFKGIPEALTDTIANRVQLFMAPLSSAISMVRDGKLRAIGVSTVVRASATPELPTIGETLPGFEFDSWGGMVAPAKTPRAVIARLNTEIGRALMQPETLSRMRALGAEPAHSTPEAFDRFIQAQLAMIASIAKRAGVTPGG